MDKSVLYGLSYGMYVVGASDAGRPVGCIINTCIQITSDEPVLAVSLNKNNYTLSAVKRTRRFGLSVIAERTDRSIIPIFGFQCSRDCDKYAAYGYDSLRGVPLVKGCFAGRLVCEVLHTVDCGTHEVVFARLLDTLPGEPDAHPMTYEYYHKVVKGRARPTGPRRIRLCRRKVRRHPLQRRNPQLLRLLRHLPLRRRMLLFRRQERRITSVRSAVICTEEI